MKCRKNSESPDRLNYNTSLVYVREVQICSIWIWNYYHEWLAVAGNLKFHQGKQDCRESPQEFLTSYTDTTLIKAICFCNNNSRGSQARFSKTVKPTLKKAAKISIWKNLTKHGSEAPSQCFVSHKFQIREIKKIFCLSMLRK